MAERTHQERPAAMTVNGAAEAVQRTSPNESAAMEREQNQMFPEPGNRAVEQNPAD